MWGNNPQSCERSCSYRGNKIRACTAEFRMVPQAQSLHGKHRWKELLTHAKTACKGPSPQIYIQNYRANIKIVNHKTSGTVPRKTACFLGLQTGDGIGTVGAAVAFASIEFATTRASLALLVYMWCISCRRWKLLMSPSIAITSPQSFMLIANRVSINWYVKN